MTPRYLEVEQAINYIKNYIFYYDFSLYKKEEDFLELISCLKEEVCDILDTLETDPDIVLQKHGWWIPITSEASYCSECRIEQQNTDYMPNYCPNCGSKMDKWSK